MSVSSSQTFLSQHFQGPLIQIVPGFRCRRPLQRPHFPHVFVVLLKRMFLREECGMDLPVQIDENGVPAERWVKPSQYEGRLKPNGKKPRVANMGVPTVPGVSPVTEDLTEEYGIQTRG